MFVYIIIILLYLFMYISLLYNIFLKQKLFINLNLCKDYSPIYFKK